MTVKFSYRNMEPGDAHEIMKRMWAPGEEELDRIGMDKNPHAMAVKFISIAAYGYTFFVDEEMVAICGTQESEGVHYTWFMATPDINKVGREFTLWLRKFAHDKVAEEGVKLEMYSASLHPNSDRWFFALGFERGDKEAGIYRHYRYTRKNKLTVNA